MRRGDVWWAALGEPAGTRPVVIVTRDAAIEVRSQVTVATVSSRRRGIPTEVYLGREDGLPKDCAANTDNLYTISKHRLQRRITRLRSDKAALLDQALRYALGLL